MDQLKDRFFYTFLCLICFIIGAILGNVAPLNQQEKRQPIIIYTVDNAGGLMIGKVTSKAIVDSKYTLDCGVYGKFIVTKEVYDSVKVGDPIPEYLKKRGN